MLTQKVSIYTLLITSLVVSVTTYFLCYGKMKNNHSQTDNSSNKSISVSTNQITSMSCDYTIQRLQGYKFIKPLVQAEQACESGKYAELKKQITELIDNKKQSGDIISASVYLRDFNKAEWLSINETETYNPGSLIKLPILISYLRMEEAKPGILQKKLLYTAPKELPRQTFNANQIQSGKTYTIKELLKYMIAYSDNNATFLLNNNVDLDVVRKLFADLDLVVPDMHDRNFQISAKNYSQFLKVVYNASYLNIENSEFAAELLSQCDFQMGIKKGLPNEVALVHKFGEWGDKTTHQLSESGIVYMDNYPYLLTIMTKGNDVSKLPEVISGISKLSYTSLKEKQVNF